MQDLKDKVALVTGAGSGIGAAVAATLSGRGARVVLTDVDLAQAERRAADLRAQGAQALACHLDVTEAASCQAAAAQAVAQFGRLDCAVNNAGVATPLGKLAEIDPQEWSRQLAVNLSGVFHCMQAQIPWMLQAGGGAIVNLASIAGVNGIQGRAAYVAAKHGVVGLSKSAALDYAEQGIRINAVAPGYVDTPLLQGRSASERERIEQLHPMNRMSTDGEQAALIAFLLSDAATFITGAVMLNDGGFSAR